MLSHSSPVHRRRSLASPGHAHKQKIVLLSPGFGIESSKPVTVSKKMQFNKHTKTWQLLTAYFGILLIIVGVIGGATLLIMWLIRPKHSNLVSYGLTEKGFKAIGSEDDFYHSLLVLGITAEWNEVRFRNQKQNCQYLNENNVRCELIPAMDGRKMTVEYKETLINSHRISADFPGWEWVGKIGCAESSIRAMEKAADLMDRYQQFRHILILEDDATINDGFLNHLRSLLFHIPNDWNVINLQPSYRCTNWFYRNFWFEYIRPTIYSYPSGPIYGGFTFTTAVLYRKGTIPFLLSQLPMTDYNDLWLGTFVQSSEINAYYSCPALVSDELHYQSSLIGY